MIANRTLTFKLNREDINLEKRRVKSVISTNDVNRYGFILRTDGLVNLEDYRSNPVVLLNHNHDWLVGRNLTIEAKNDKLIALTQFNKTPKGKETNELMNDGDLNAFSVAFNPLEFDETEDGIPVVTKWELEEYSIVAVPANPKAVKLAFKKAKDTDIKNYFKLQLDNQNNMELDELTKLVEDINNKVTDIATRIQSLEDWKKEMTPEEDTKEKTEEALNKLKIEVDKLSKEFRINRIENKVLEGLLT